jgi:hypothetical protein
MNTLVLNDLYSTLSVLIMIVSVLCVLHENKKGAKDMALNQRNSGEASNVAAGYRVQVTVWCNSVDETDKFIEAIKGFVVSQFEIKPATPSATFSIKRLAKPCAKLIKASSDSVKCTEDTKGQAQEEQVGDTNDEESISSSHSSRE